MLKTIKEIPADTLLAELKQNRLELRDMHESPQYDIYMIGVIVLVLTIILIVLFLIQKKLQNSILKCTVSQGKV